LAGKQDRLTTTVGTAYNLRVGGQDFLRLYGVKVIVNTRKIIFKWI
jgi:hypothetical protein